MQLKAFTIVELVMVVTLIGIMAIFAIPNYSKAVEKAHEKDASSNLSAIYAGQKIYFNNNNTYAAPASVNTTANINTTLGLGIIGNGVSYICPTGTGAVFSCQANRDTGAYKLKVTESNPTPCCCAAGTCPSIVTVCGAACS